MASDFHNVLSFRNFICIGARKNVQIINRQNKSFNEALEIALDQLYRERLLEDGKCTVCQNKTTKCCSVCGTHYCSIMCQSYDWVKHKSKCMSSSSKTITNATEKPVKSDDKNIDFMYNHGNFNMGKPRTGENSKNSTPAFRYSSYPDVSIAGRSTEDEESCKESNIENPKNMKYLKSQNLQKKETKYFRKRESDQKRDRGKESSFKKFSPLQKLQVKPVTTNKDHYWVIEKSNEENFKKIQDTLASEWNTYPVSSTVPACFFATRFQNTWFRCKAIVREPKLIIRCVDTGQVFCPKQISCLELPESLKNHGLAFKVIFKDSKPREMETEWLNIQIMKVLPNGSYEVKLCDDKSEKNVVDEALNFKKKVNKKKKRQPEETPKKNPPSPPSVIDELKVSTKGIFLPSMITKDLIFGCLAPEDVNSAMHCYNSIRELYLADGHIIEGSVGDYVMVAGEDTTGHRGIIVALTEDRYKVRLIDYGYEIETESVYQLPEKMADMMRLECCVTLLDFPPRRCHEFEVKRGYDMEVMRKNENGHWVCKFATYPDLDEVFALGIVCKPLKLKRKVHSYVPFENNDLVLITGVGSENAVHIKHIPGEKWDDMLEKLNLKINTGPQEPDLLFKDINIGDIILSKYNYDGLWYRAEVLQKKKDKTVRVVFVDYGNFQFSREAQLRKLPEGINEPHFTTRVTLSGPGTAFTPEGREYLSRLKDDRAYVKLLLTGNDITKDVVLLDENGVELNKRAFATEVESDAYSDSSCVGFDKKNFLKPEGFQLGVVEEFVCISIGRESFFKTGVFWGFNAGVVNFTDIVKMGEEMSTACESDLSEYLPQVGDLCIVHYQEHWFRGHILNKFGFCFEVFFIDFGNSRIIESWNVRKMLPQFLEIPAVASKCLISEFPNLKDKEILNIYDFLSKTVKTVIKNRVVVVNVIGDEHYIELKDV